MMQLSTETVGRLLASGRNYVGQIIAFGSAIGLMSAAQNKGLTDALNEMYNGLNMIFHGATSAWTILVVVAAPIVGPMLARFASKSAKVDNQAAAVNLAVTDPNTVVSPEAKTNIATAAAGAMIDKSTPIPPEAKAAIMTAAAMVKP